MMMITPMKVLNQNAGALDKTRMFSTENMIIVPMIVPTMVPLPPVSSVPPITVAPIAYSSMP
jgi:hypothetical protein